MYDAWAGIVDEVFTGECSSPCPEDAACHRVAAVALAGVVAGSRWYASARPSRRSETTAGRRFEPAQSPRNPSHRRTSTRRRAH